MSGFMTAADKHALLRRSMRPRPSRVTPELVVRIVANLDEQIAMARHYAAAMVEQHNHALASYGFAEVGRMERLRGFYAGTPRKDGDDG